MGRAQTRGVEAGGRTKGGIVIETVFVITAEEVDTITKWQQKHEKKCKAGQPAVGGRYMYCFTSTSIGTMGSVRCVCGKEKDFTDYDKL